MIQQFAAIALGTLVSEDLTCIATGVLIAQHRMGFLEGTLACVTGIFLGDVLLYLAGRTAAHPQVLGKWIPEHKLRKASQWIEDSGLKVVLLSRFTPGLRLPTYLAAGVLRARFLHFAGYILLASALWTPLLVGASAIFGKEALAGALGQDRPLLVFLAAAALFVAAKLRDYTTRRHCVGFLRRKVRWEFWPVWAVYLPLIPYLLFLAIRHRSLTVFTAANPGMFAGGLMGESKSEILRHLGNVPGAVAEFLVVPPGGRVKVSEFPIVLKPDVGERGAGVRIARTQPEVDAYLQHATKDTILQRYVPGCEFGVYYSQGEVLYVTEKRFPSVTGDGKRSLHDLILADPRAVCMASSYFAAALFPLENVPSPGERVRLVEIGSHCRGTIFLDGSRLITPALNKAIRQISSAHPGFHIGRYDVRSESPEALQRGEFTVIELNGVGAEATHIYDPHVGLLEAYRIMARHWRTAFALGARNRSQGARPMTTRELWQLLVPPRTRAARPTTDVA